MEHLQPIRLNAVDVDWARQDLSYLQPDAYNALIRRRLAGASPVCLCHSNCAKPQRSCTVARACPLVQKGNPLLKYCSWCHLSVLLCQ